MTWSEKITVWDLDGWISYPDGFIENGILYLAVELNRHDVYFIKQKKSFKGKVFFFACEKEHFYDIIKHMEKNLYIDIGVDGVFIGPNDMSADYGCLGNNNAPEILSAIEKIACACKKTGKAGGIITGNKAYLSKAKQCGLEYYCKGSELNAISEYCKKITKEIGELE